MWARERQRYTEGGTASCRGREPESSRRLTLTRYAIDLLVWVHSKSLTLELNSWRLHLEKQMWIWSTPITSFSLSSPPSPPPQPKIHKVSLQTSMREWKVYVVEKQNISLLLRSECLHANVCCCLLILYIIYVCCVVVPSLDEDACRASERERSFICVCLKTICLGVKTRFTSLTFIWNDWSHYPPYFLLLRFSSFLLLLIHCPSFRFVISCVQNGIFNIYGLRKPSCIIQAW